MPTLVGTRKVPLLGRKFKPSDLPGLALWLDASTVGQADNTPVASWRDLSGHGNTATQGTSAAQPTYKAAGLNGYPALSFDGVDDALLLVTQGTVAAYSIFAVWEWTSGIGHNQFPWSNTGVGVTFPGGTYATDLGIDGTGTASAYNGGPGANLVGVTIPVLYPTIEGVVAVSGVVWDIYQNGSHGGTSTDHPPATVLPSGQIGHDGSGIYLTGTIAQLLMFSRALSTGERHQVEAYLGARYRIAVVAQ